MTYNFSKVKVLIVEDSQPMTQITMSLLKSFGVKHVDTADTADKGFRKFCTEKHDLIIIDWLIKPFDGIELTEKFRMDPHTPNPYVPIILMTGFSEKKRVLLARDKGVTEFLVKPFTSNELYKKVDHIIMKPRQFVKAPNFFGPDRRRKVIKDAPVPQRRETDIL